MRSFKGALTGRPYPFTIRIWEHVFKCSIDYTDAFGQNLFAGIAYNKIRRLIPNIINLTENTPWINDRTRFSFEGMPSKNTIKSIKLKNQKSLHRKKLGQIAILLFYFFDHLKTHLLKIDSFIFVIGTTISLEILGALLFTFNKYSFIKLKTSELLPKPNDLESSFQLNASTININNLLKSDLCFLIGINTRYEGSYLNLKLKKRYAKSNFNIISLSSLLDLTFPTFILGSNIKMFNVISTGNSLINQKLKNANYPILIFNSNYFHRTDNVNDEFTIIENLKFYTRLSTKNWNGINILNFSFNDVGINSLNHFKPIKPNDLIKCSSLYFINLPPYVYFIKKFLELKILIISFQKRINTKKVVKTAFYHGANIETNFWIAKKIEKNTEIKNSFFTITKNFYNKNETYLNAEGSIKKSTNIIFSNLKNDWAFLRKIYKDMKKIIFTQNTKNQKYLVVLKSKRSRKIERYLALHFCPVKVFTKLLFRKLSSKKPFIAKTYKFPFFLTKSFNTKVKFWIQDFYLGNKDLYSRYGITMIESSSYIRTKKSNFIL